VQFSGAAPLLGYVYTFPPVVVTRETQVRQSNVIASTGATLAWRLMCHTRLCLAGAEIKIFVTLGGIHMLHMHRVRHACAALP
jgi:hypothetical protein